MYQPKKHYLVCKSCGWSCSNQPPAPFYRIGDHCKECGKELTKGELLYKQARI